MTKGWIKKVASTVPLAAASGIFSLPTGGVPDGTPTNAIPDFIANRILDYFSLIAFPIALVGIIYTAYIMMTSMGNPEAYAKAKRNLIYLLTGIALVLFASIIFVTVRSFFSSLS